MMLIDMVEHKKVSVPEIQEITVIRYYEEIVIRLWQIRGCFPLNKIL